MVITGAASGIGLGLATEAARKGATVVLWDRDGAALDAAIDAVDAARTGPAEAPLAQLVDVTDRDAVQEAAALAIEQTGGVDILVNNAGVVSGKWLTDLDEADVRRTFEVNTLALYWVTQGFLSHMMERDRGRVVTIASASGLIGVAKLTDYSASKWAAIGFDESLRVELKVRGSQVATTVVCPYYINTGMFTGVKSRVEVLLPILEPDHFVAKTWAAVEKGKQRLHLPPLTGTLPVMRMLPVRAFDATAGLLGVNQSMDEFRGRARTDTPSAPSEVPADR
ncbi:SDR family oxidoreductase [soil metagenome]